MSRDMKSRRNQPAKKKSGGGTLVGMFIGLVLGVAVAAGVVWYMNKSPLPFANKGAAPTRPEPVAAAGKPVEPMALPGKPGDPIPQGGDKPRFDFYKILPGNAEAIPDPKPAESKAADAKGKDAKDAKEATLKEPLYLQAGSFQNAGDADNQKAKLAMLGAEATIQQVMVQDKVWFRVRLGPFSKMDDVNRLRADLAKQGVEANVVKKD